MPDKEKEDPETRFGDDVLVVDKKDIMPTTDRVMAPEEICRSAGNLTVPMAG